MTRKPLDSDDDKPAWSRREFFSAGAVAAAAGGVLPAAAASAAHGSTYADNIYTRMFGVRPIYGAFESLTSYGNSRPSAEVQQAMAAASDYFVDVEELERAAGRKIARIMGAEAAMVTSGTAGSMLLAVAACMTGADPEKMEALPQATWPKQECLLQTAHRFVYDRMYRAAGATVVYRDTRQQLVDAISERTALIAAMAMTERQPRPGVLTIAELVQISKQARVPLLVDCAGEPTPRNLTRYLDLGADLVMVSGGKAIQGPSSTGILAGRADLIEAALLNAAPNHMIGRGMKVSKEAIVGLVVALEQFVNRDEAAMLSRCTAMARYIAGQLNGIPGLMANTRLNSKGFEDVEFRWDPAVFPIGEKEVAEALLNGEPRVAFMPKIPYAYGGPTLVTELLRPGEEVVIARRIREYFRHWQAG